MLGLRIGEDVGSVELARFTSWTTAQDAQAGMDLHIGYCTLRMRSGGYRSLGSKAECTTQPTNIYNCHFNLMAINSCLNVLKAHLIERKPCMAF